MTSKQDAAEFVDRHRAELIQRVRKVMPIADDLLRRGMIQYEMFSNITTSKTNQGKMREVYKALQSGGTPLKAAFYRILLENERILVINLGKVLSLPLPDAVCRTTVEYGIFTNVQFVTLFPILWIRT
uniref:CARD domain-containing protein n=1 Tax=Hucho hucho TaxID=62062 RepID=A0A4W5LSI6_9TELE